LGGIIAFFDPQALSQNLASLFIDGQVNLAPGTPFTQPVLAHLPFSRPLDCQATTRNDQMQRLGEQPFLKAHCKALLSAANLTLIRNL
jgi:hypothetical protein